MIINGIDMTGCDGEQWCLSARVVGRGSTGNRDKHTENAGHQLRIVA
jgi:hypothetical protein